MVIDWLLIAALAGIVGLHWLFQLLPGKERNMWCSELSLERVCVKRQGSRSE